jgi:hypothetical protein
MPNDSLSQIMDRFSQDLERYIQEEVRRQISSQQKTVSAEPPLIEKPLSPSPAPQMPEITTPVSVPQDISVPNATPQNAAWEILKRLKEKKKQ